MANPKAPWVPPPCGGNVGARSAVQPKVIAPPGVRVPEPFGDNRGARVVQPTAAPGAQPAGAAPLHRGLALPGRPSPAVQPAVRPPRGGGREPGTIQPLFGVGNTLSDAVIGSVATVGSNLSWLTGVKQVTRLYNPVLSSAGFGTGMFAILAPGHTKNVGGQAAHLAPQNDAWDALTKRKANIKGGAYYVRAHLLRDHYFGGQAQWNNLVPLTSKANNPSPLSHLHQVEEAVQHARGQGHWVGYRVIPIYGGLPLFDLPRTIVNTLAGWLPIPWISELSSILYYETQIPTALWTSWWYQDSWNPLPSISVIRNWTSFSEASTYFIHTFGNHARALYFSEWLLLAVVEVCKAILTAFSPLGIWSRALGLLSGYFPWLPSIFGVESVVAILDRINDAYPRLARVIGNVMGRDILEDPRAWAGRLAGFIPSGATLVMGAQLLTGR